MINKLDSIIPILFLNLGFYLASETTILISLKLNIILYSILKENLQVSWQEN